MACLFGRWWTPDPCLRLLELTVLPGQESRKSQPLSVSHSQVAYLDQPSPLSFFLPPSKLDSRFSLWRTQSCLRSCFLKTGTDPYIQRWHQPPCRCWEWANTSVHPTPVLRPRPRAAGLCSPRCRHKLAKDSR